MLKSKALSSLAIAGFFLPNSSFAQMPPDNKMFPTASQCVSLKITATTPEHNPDSGVISNSCSYHIIAYYGAKDHTGGGMHNAVFILPGGSARIFSQKGWPNVGVTACQIGTYLTYANGPKRGMPVQGYGVGEELACLYRAPGSM